MGKRKRAESKYKAKEIKLPNNQLNQNKVIQFTRNIMRMIARAEVQSLGETCESHEYFSIIYSSSAPGKFQALICTEREKSVQDSRSLTLHSVENVQERLTSSAHVQLGINIF